MQTVTIKRKSVSKKTGEKKEKPQSVRILNPASNDAERQAALEDAINTLGLSATYKALNSALHRGSGEKKTVLAGMTKGSVKSLKDANLTPEQIEAFNAKVAELEAFKAQLLGKDGAPTA